MDFKDKSKSGRTFYGWSLHRDLSGDIFLPGGTLKAEYETNLYAAAVHGTVVTGTAGKATYTADRISDDSSLDLRFTEGVTQVTVDKKTMALFAAEGKGIRILYDNMEVTYSAADVAALAKQNGTVFKATLHDDVLDVAASVPGMSALICSPTVRIPWFTLDGQLKDRYGNELERDIVDEYAVFKLSAAPKAQNTKYSFCVVDSGWKSMAPDFKGYPAIRFSSDTWITEGKLSAGDTLSISDAEGMKHTVSGADKNEDGTYAVVGNVTVLVEAKTGDHKVIMPAKQTGYTLKASPEIVKDGGRCVLTFKLLTGYTNTEMVLKVNGKAVDLDSASRTIINNISEDVTVEVSGIYDVRKYEIRLPGTQTGYVLSASTPNIHHGLSYSMTFALAEGYEKTPAFNVLVNGKALHDVGGKYDVSDVTGPQNVSVTGVQMKRYSVTAGANTQITVNGIAATTVTVEDVITVNANGIRSLPSTYVSNLPSTVKVSGNGYKVVGDTEFPSIYRVTVGDNVTAAGGTECLDVCTADKIRVAGAAGYALPDNYAAELAALDGHMDAEGFCTFGSDVTLPSVYKIAYMCGSTVFKELFGIKDKAVPETSDVPTKKGYEFSKWSDTDATLTKNSARSAEWTPIKYTVKFGDNIRYSINGAIFSKSSTMELSIEDNIGVVAKTGFSLPKDYLNRCALISDSPDIYHITDNYTFETILCVTFFYNFKSVRLFCEYSDRILLPSPIDEKVSSLFSGVNVSEFKGWQTEEGVLCDSIIEVKENLKLTPKM